MMLVAAGIVVAAVLALKIAVLILEPRLTFYPTRSYPATPRSLGLPFEDVRLSAGDGVVLHGWFIPGAIHASGARITLLVFHGNAENIGGGLDLAVRARTAGYSLLLVDYRGYGESTGQPSESGLYRDGRAALAYLRTRPDVDASRIVVWGRSIGSAVAVALAAGDAATRPSTKDGSVLPAGVILESPFSSATDLLRDGGHWLLLGLSRFGTYRFDSAARMPRVVSPILIIHGTADDIVPIASGRRLFDLAPGRRTFVPIEGGGHNDLWIFHADEVWNAAKTFLGSLG